MVLGEGSSSTNSPTISSSTATATSSQASTAASSSQASSAATATQPSSSSSASPTTSFTIPTTNIQDKCDFKKNSLGNCECGEQLFVSNDCLKAFYCMDDDALEQIGENPEQVDGCELVCEDDEILIADPRQKTWYCLKKIGPMPLLCPGGFKTECGCSGTDEECPIGDCECDGQLRVNNDCTHAKICKENDYEDFTCDADLDEIVMVDLRTEKIFCGKDDGRCPGAFHVGCNITYPSSSSPTTHTTSETSSEATSSQSSSAATSSQSTSSSTSSQSSSTSGTSSQSTLSSAASTQSPSSTAASSQSTSADATSSKSTSSAATSSQSPSSESSATEPSTTFTIPSTDIQDKCNIKKNSLGHCDCPEQLFVSNDCMSAFYCMDDDTLEDMGHNPDEVDGCELVCEEDEILIADPREKTWYCIPNDGVMPMKCPGGFNTECGCSGSDEECPIGDCDCDGQLRVNNDCTYAKVCDFGTYQNYTCDGLEDLIVMVNLRTNRIYCGKDDGRCPGAFHVGCNMATDTSTSSKPTSSSESSSQYTISSDTSTTTTATSSSESSSQSTTTSDTSTTTTATTSSTTSGAQPILLNFVFIFFSILIIKY